MVEARSAQGGTLHNGEPYESKELTMTTLTTKPRETKPRGAVRGKQKGAKERSQATEQMTWRVVTWWVSGIVQPLSCSLYPWSHSIFTVSPQSGDSCHCLHRWEKCGSQRGSNSRGLAGSRAGIQTQLWLTSCTTQRVRHQGRKGERKGKWCHTVFQTHSMWY